MAYFCLALGSAELGLGLWALGRLWRRDDSGRLLALGILAWLLGALAGLLPECLTALGLPMDPLWPGLGRLLRALLDPMGWLLLYLGWERAWSREIRDGLLFWTACGAALLSLLLCALRSREWLAGTQEPFRAALSVLPLVILAAVVCTAWYSVRAKAPAGRILWALLALRLLLTLAALALEFRWDPLAAQIPLRLAELGILWMLPARGK